MTDQTDLYEITLILKEGSDVGENENLLKDEIEIKKSTDLQTRQFAYPIGKLTSGHYFAIEFVCPSENLQKIQQHLKDEKSLIRYLITKAIRKGPEPVRTGIYAKKETTPDQTATPEQPAVKEETKAQEVKAETIAKPAKEPIPAPEEETTKKTSEETNAPEEKDLKTEIKAKKEKPAEAPKKKPAADEKKTVTRKPRAKAEKLSAEELDKKLEELVKE